MGLRNDLMAQLEILDHNLRMERMVEFGRRAAREPAVAAALREMESSGITFERRLAVTACHGSRDGAHVLRALNDPSGLVARLAMKLVAVACDDRQARTALDAASLTVRRNLFVALAMRDRQDVIDDFLDAAVRRGPVDADLARLIPFGSVACVGRHQEAFAPVADLPAWTRLARNHPDSAASLITARAAATDRLDARLIWVANAVLVVISDTRPTLALALLREVTRHAPFSKLQLGVLPKRLPNEVADLLLASEDWPYASFESVVDRLDPARLFALAERRPQTLGSPYGYLRHLPRERRAELHSAFARGWRTADGSIDYLVMWLLPREPREQEARRHLDLPALAARPVQRLRYASFLPWEEAMRTLDPFLRSPDPALCAAAASAFTECARFHPDRLAELIAFVIARKNEQDPIRSAYLHGLASLPPGRWRSEHLDGLGQIIRQALDAADLSATTAAAAERLIMGLLPFHSEWSAGWVATLVRERGQMSLYGLSDRLNDQDVKRLTPMLLPVFASWETRERRPQLIAAAQTLGRRLRAFDGLADILENVLYEQGESWQAMAALQLLYDHRRDRIPRLIPALIAHDPSWATQPLVYNYLHLRAQSLLTPFLGRQAYAGRFSTGRTRFVLPVDSGFFRWTPKQQATFAKTLTELTQDEERDTPVLLAAIVQLSALPDVPPARLMLLADVRNTKLAVRDAALRGLARLDAGRGVSALVHALNDERARIAIYALRSALKAMPPAAALALLRRVPTDKVTVAKEVVRLLGELRTDEAFADLLAMAKAGGAKPLHRDVRVAPLRALWDFTDRPAAWPLLLHAAGDPDPDVAAGVVYIPTERLSADGQRRLAGLLAKLLTHADAKLRVDVLTRVAQLPVTDADRALMPGLLRSMGSLIPDESAAAVSAVFATYAGREASRVGEAVAQLISNRRALVTVVNKLESALPLNRAHLLPTAQAVLDVLAADPLTAAARARLAVRALPPAELVAELGSMAAAGTLHADALASAVAATTSEDWPDKNRWDGVASSLLAQSDDRLRRIGLAALVAAAGAARGWDDDRLARLTACRADSSPLVAGAAQFTFANADGAENLSCL